MKGKHEPDGLGDVSSSVSDARMWLWDTEKQPPAVRNLWWLFKSFLPPFYKTTEKAYELNVDVFHGLLVK